MTGTRTFLKALLLVVWWALTGSLATQAQADKKADIEQLQKSMYQYFNTKEIDKFLEVTEQLKDACLEAGDERMFYRAWGNQAIYNGLHVSRDRGMQTARELREYATRQDSKYGLYTATYVSANMLANMGQIDSAIENYQKAIDYLHRFFPDENAAPAYISLSDMANNRSQHAKAIEYSQQALAEPNITPLQRLTAWSQICVTYGRSDDKEHFMQAYEQREKAKQTYGSTDHKEHAVQTYHALFTGQYERALQEAQSIRTNFTRLKLISLVYEKKGDYKEALAWYKRYRATTDSINTSDLRRYSEEYASQLDVARAENESKDLRLANQLQAEKVRRTRYWLAGCVMAVILLSLLFYTIRRRHYIRHLEHINRRLELAQQAEHEARQAAEQALQVKRHFLNNISHEMRTPLNSISGFSEVLTTSGTDISAEEKDKLNRLIAENTHLLTDIIDKMIELSYYDSLNKLECADAIMVNSLCRAMQEEYQHKADPKKVTVSFTPTLADDAILVSNRSSLERTLRHVLDNAISFTPAGGQVTISVHSADGQLFSFSVSDTGPGIPAERHHAVFEQFSETGGDVQTTGIGLSICHTICQLLGGEIRVDADWQDGCRIVFDIPTADSAHLPHSAALDHRDGNLLT